MNNVSPYQLMKIRVFGVTAIMIYTMLNKKENVTQRSTMVFGEKKHREVGIFNFNNELYKNSTIVWG